MTTGERKTFSIDDIGRAMSAIRRGVPFRGISGDCLSASINACEFTDFYRCGQCKTCGGQLVVASHRIQQLAREYGLNISVDLGFQNRLWDQVGPNGKGRARGLRVLVGDSNALSLVMVDGRFTLLTTRVEKKD